MAPGVERARAEGIDATGPLPADTVFFRAGRGDFDLVVAMYHDQGHGPVKVMALEAGVNITVGLRVIRTSGGPRHGVRHRGHREGRSPQPDRGAPPGRPVGDRQVLSGSAIRTAARGGTC